MARREVQRVRAARVGEWLAVKLDIVHAELCGCVVDGEAIYVRAPCVVRNPDGRLTKHRLGQLLHGLGARRKSTS